METRWRRQTYPSHEHARSDDQARIRLLNDISCRHICSDLDGWLDHQGVDHVSAVSSRSSTAISSRVFRAPISSVRRAVPGWPSSRFALKDDDCRRPLSVAGITMAVAVGIKSAVGTIERFSSPQKLVSSFGLNPSVRQSGLGPAQHGRITKQGRAHARAMLVEAAWAASKAPGPLRDFSSQASGPAAATRSPPLQRRAKWPRSVGIS